MNKIEKEEGREIQEINVGEVQTSKNELLLKEHILKANEIYYKGEYEKAVECYDKVLEIDPKHTIALGNKGLALAKVGKYNEAIWSFDKVLEMDNDSVIAWYSKGVSLSKRIRQK
jgi:tetratricopeptide (TPR) repeat protein